MDGRVRKIIKKAIGRMPEHVKAVTGMLSYEERALLYGLARDLGGKGAIVDAGCFIGGSTVALAAGLVDGRHTRPGLIHSYDLLKVDPWQTTGYLEEIDRMEPGTSLRPLFERNIGAYRHLVTLHEGDMLAERWDAEPVEILFVDVCKTWELNAHLVSEFFPALVPGSSVVVQQDLAHWGHPWCAMVMEALAHRFEYIGWTWFSSSVWRCRSLPTPEELSSDWRYDIGLERGLELLRASSRRHGGRAEVELELARAELMVQFGDGEAAFAEVDRVEQRYGSSVPWIEQGYATVRHRAAELELQ